MTRITTLSGLLLAAGAVALAPRADADGAERKDEAVTYDVATHTTHAQQRSAKTGTLAAAADRVRRRPGAPAASGKERSEDAPRPRKVFGNDDRYEILDPTAYPWSAVVKVMAHYPRGVVLEGSGIMVAERHALTAGHVIYDASLGGFATSVEIVPAYDQGDAPFGRFVADDITSFRGFTEDDDLDFDFALLTLDGDAGTDTGWLGLTVATDGELVGETINTGGFPADIQSGEVMFGASGECETVTSGQLLFRGEMDAARGQSGSGVWQRYSDGRYLVGILSSETTTYNRAARITQPVFDALDAWIGDVERADLAVTSVSDALPAEFEGALTATVSVGVRNDGGVGATTNLDVSARDVFGATTFLGTRSIYLAAGESQSFRVTIDVPASLGGATYDVVAEVNADGSVDETDFDDDLRVGERFVALPPFFDLTVNQTLWETMAPGDVVRFRLDVPDALRRLKLDVMGSRWATATVTRADGSAFTLFPGATGRTERTPEGGAWLVDIRHSVAAPRTKDVRFRSRAR